MDNICKNCNTSYNGNFCSHCGQKYNVHRFTSTHIFHEIFHAFTHADKGFLVLAKQLIINPATVAYEYIIECKRKKYFNIFTFFLIISAISIFISSKEIELKENMFKIDDEFGYFLNKYSKFLQFLIIPLMAFMLWLINYKKNSVKYIEYLVFSIILVSIDNIINIFVNIINYIISRLIDKDFNLDEKIGYPIFLILFYSFICYQFHKKIQKTNIFKGLLSGFWIVLLQILIIIFIIWAIVRQFHGLGILNLYGISISK